MEGPPGPTGLKGMDGPQGQPIRGPRGPTGAIGNPSLDSVTGPTGIGGGLGPTTDRIHGIPTIISTYGTGPTGMTTANITSSSTPSTLWSIALPNLIKGKNGLLSMFFDVSTNYLIPPQTAFDFGIFVDDVSLSRGPSAFQRYTQLVPDRRLISGNGIQLGGNVSTSFFPISMPVSINPNANELRIRTANASVGIDALVVSSSTTVFSNTGLSSYTTPAGSIGVIAYVWGAGGTSHDSNSGGPGGFSFGYYECPPSTAIGVIVGGVATNTFNTGFGGAGGNGTQGGGGGFSGVFLGASPTASINMPLVIAGGGGGCFIGSIGPTLSWVGGGGGGITGASAFHIWTSSFATDGQSIGGTQLGSGANASQWRGASYNGAGAGGGGYFGGGNSVNTSRAGGGGSGFLNASIRRGYLAPAITSFIGITPGTANMITQAPCSNIMIDFGLSPSTYSHGGGGNGCVVIIPVTGITTPIVNVDARFTSL